MTEVRLATVADGDAIARLRRTWTEENAGQSIPDDTFESRFEEWLERERRQRLTWLGFVDGIDDPVGMLNLLVFTRMPFPLAPATERPTQWGYLANCFVRAEHRNTGLGGDLLDACTIHADDHGFARIVLSPS